uniref:Fat-body protein 1 n=3 Tax=Zeugodacus cucurbitae TaxID=28588 RepID=A0A0A1WW25_ZEUCU
MKIFILALILLIGVAAAAVLDNVDIRRVGTGNIGTRRISEMSPDDLLHQKFLLDILRHVQEPNVSEQELPQLSSLQPVQLVDDETLYNGGIDDEMAHVLELSRNQDLLAKHELYSLADDEHMRQMIGLYRLLVRSRDWDTLQRNLLYARVHVNGVLLVNSMLLAIRDRDDTQNLVMPGIHEILPALYLDEDLLRRANEIHLQSGSNISFQKQTQRPGILEMVGLNKLWNRDANSVDTLDRRQLWMPWREMRMELQARKVVGGNAATRISLHDDNRIVLPVTLPTSVLREEREARLLTNDVGLQSFLQSLVNELCLIESESMQQNEQRARVEKNRAVLGRVGLERNVGSVLKSELRRTDEKVQGQNMRDVYTVDLDTNEDGRDSWMNRNMLSNARPSDRRQGAYINDDYDRDTSQVGWDNSRVSVRLPKTTADDERLLYVNRKRQHAAAINQMYLRGEQPGAETDLNGRWGQTDGYRVNKRDTIHTERIDLGEGMPMDWNRQMAMHRLQKNRVVDTQINDTPAPLNIGYNNEKTNNQVPVLPTVDITNERLVHVGRRRLNQWRKENQPMESVLDERRNTDINREGWENVYENTDRSWLNAIHRNRQDARSKGRVADDTRIWTTVARGMGNIGIHVGQEANGVNEIKTDARLRNNISRRPLNNDPTHTISSNEGEPSYVKQHRSPRSLYDNVVLNRKRYVDQKRDGELLLHNLQQLMARINLEQINLGLGHPLQLLDDTIASSRFNNARPSNALDQRLVLRLNKMRLNSRRNRLLLNHITEVERRLQRIIENEILRVVEIEQRNDIRNKGDVDQLIGDILIGKRSVDQDVNFLNILREIILQTEDINGSFQKLNQISMDIENQIVLHLLRRIVQIADLQRQQSLGSYRNEELLMDGVSINDVIVGKLRTYVDTNDVDLINTIGVRTSYTPGRTADISQRTVVARQQRLNHQPFTIKVVVSTNRNKRVIVRTLLVPQAVTSDLGTTQLNRLRQNFILLDTYMTDLQSGRNVITRQSDDISWTARDTTPFTEIYKRVMKALESDVAINWGQVRGQSCRFPHRLLLPRGRVDGLPMQLLVIITPAETDGRPTVQEMVMNNKICGMGVSSMNLDQMPLGFPLDRPIESMEEIGSLPNARLLDVKIFHSKQLVADDFY